MLFCILATMMFPAISIVPTYASVSPSSIALALSDPYTCTSVIIPGSSLFIAQDGPGPIVDARGIYVIFANSTDLFLGFSDDGGHSYAVSIIATGRGINDPRITLAPNHLYATWNEMIGKVHYIMESTNLTALGFGTPKAISESFGGVGSESAAVGSNFYVAFIGTGQVIMVAVSHDYGQDFTLLQIGSSQYPGKEINLVAVNSDVYLAYESKGSPLGPKNTAVFAASVNNGNTFTVSQITNKSVPKEAIVVASPHRAVYIDWRAGGGKANDIYLARSNDSGSTFQSIQDVSNNAGDSREPWIAVDGKIVYVSYRDTTNSTTGSYNVFLSVSDNFGRKFTTLQLSNETYVTSLEADDYSPEVAASRGTVGVIWSSATGGYEQEYISLSGNAGVSFQTVKLDNSTYDRSSLLNVAGTEYYGMWESGTGVGVAVCA